MVPNSCFLVRLAGFGEPGSRLVRLGRLLTPADLGLPSTVEAENDTTGLSLGADPLDALLPMWRYELDRPPLPDGLRLLRGRRSRSRSPTPAPRPGHCRPHRRRAHRPHRRHGRGRRRPRHDQRIL